MRRGLPADPRAPRARRAAAAPGGAVPDRPPQRPAGGRARPPEHPVRQVRRAEVPGSRPREGRAGAAPGAGEPARRGGLVPRAAAARGHGPGLGAAGDGGDRARARRRRRGERGARGRPSGRRLDPLARFLESLPPAPAAAGPELEALRDGLGRLHRGRPAGRRAGRTAPAVPRAVVRPAVRRRAAARLRDLEQLEALAARFPARPRLLAELALDPPSSTSDLAGPPLLDEDYVVLSTIHSAKGGEWDVVHVIHAADGMIPSDMATGNAEEIEEERRLFYVALTRARDALYVYFPLRFYRRPRGRAGRTPTRTRSSPGSCRRTSWSGSTPAGSIRRRRTNRRPNGRGGGHRRRPAWTGSWPACGTRSDHRIEHGYRRSAWRAVTPILEFDPDPNSVIEPGMVRSRLDVPTGAVLCFFSDVIDKVCVEARRAGPHPAAVRARVPPGLRGRLERPRGCRVPSGRGSPDRVGVPGGDHRDGLPELRRGRWSWRSGPRAHGRPRGRAERGGSRRGNLVPLSPRSP